jgi:signal transduction histidine kinase/ActR/RegA family two-component response regulator
MNADPTLAHPWHPASLPENEDERIAALHRYEILDTLPEQAFDRITRLASTILGAPISLISLVDSQRQWFKSRHGIDVHETPRDAAFCAYVVQTNNVLVINNASEDMRFCSNPLVTGAPHIRFYAGAPLTTADGFTLGSLCVIDHKPHDDITERELGILRDLAALAVDEIEIRSISQHAQKATEAKSKFIANMSHEIRTPLNAIMGFANMLEESPLSRDQRQQVATIRSSGQALLDIVNDVLDISKIEAGKLEIEHVPFSVRNVVDDICNLFSMKAAEKYILLMTEYQTPMPERVMGDPYRLRQILMNLVSNAIKFTEKGHVKIILSYTTQTKELLCAVEDTGIGIKPENLERIFDAFLQEDMTVTRKYGGTGLGLAICNRLMELMGSKLKVASKFGQGSRFFFTLHLPESDEESALQTMQAQTCNGHAPLHAHILVVEDIPLNQKVAQHTLQKIGCQVTIASSGQEALELLETKTFDAIFMDVQMPVLDGYQTTRLIRQSEKASGKKACTIIAMTASTLSEDRKACHESGMNDFISKPLQPNLLHATLEKWLSPDASCA